MNKIFVAYTTLNSIMIKRSKTYRFFSAFTLILFFSSLALPSSISAAGLLCDMDVAEMHETSQACCEAHDIEKAEHHRTCATDEHCNDELVCLHTLPQNQSEVQALVINQVKDFASLTGAVEIQDRSIDNKTLVFEPSSAIPHYTSPLFLLNSSFLN